MAFLPRFPGQTPPFVPGPGLPAGLGNILPAILQRNGIGMGVPMSQGAPAPMGGMQGPPFLRKIMGGFDNALTKLGGPVNPMLSPQEQQMAQQRQKMAIAAALLQASAPRPVGTGSFGADLGSALTAGTNAQDQFTTNALNNRLLQAQLQKLQTPEAQPAQSPVGKMLADLDEAEKAGNSFAAGQLRTALKKELGDNVDLSEVRSFRNDVIRQSEGFMTAQEGYNKVVTGAQAGTPAGDMAVTFGIMKMLDPTSVVREGEQATVQNAGGVSERIRNIYNRIVKGETLTPEQRQDFVDQAQAQFKVLVKQQERLLKDSQGFAERNDLPLEDVVPEFVRPMATQPITIPKSQPQPPRTMENPLTPQELDELKRLRQAFGLGD